MRARRVFALSLSATAFLVLHLPKGNCWTSPQYLSFGLGCCFNQGTWKLLDAFGLWAIKQLETLELEVPPCRCFEGGRGARGRLAAVSQSFCPLEPLRCVHLPLPRHKTRAYVFEGSFESRLESCFFSFAMEVPRFF